MLVLTSLLITLCGLFWINYKTSENVAPTVRLGLSLLCVGFGTIPIFFWLVFIPNFFFIFHQRVKTTGFQPVSFSCENEEAGGVRWTTDTAVTRYFRSSITLCG